jgi:GDP-L-fucose synthase
MANERVLITGVSGVAGRALVREFTVSGYNVIGATSARADLTDRVQAEELLEATRPAYVVHLAGRVHGLMGNIHSQGQAFYQNIQINTNVIEASRKVGVKKFVAMGSTAVYSDAVSLPMREDDFWLGPPHDSERGYAHAKRAMAAQLEAYLDQYGMDFAFVVSTNLYGPGDKFDEAHGHVLPSLVSKVHRAKTWGEPLEVWGTGTATRDFLYSSDAAKAILTILEHYSGVINLASGVTVTIREAVETLVRVSGYTGPVSWDSTKPDGQQARAYDVSRLSALGWAPKVTLEQGLAKTHEWYVGNFATARR